MINYITWLLVIILYSPIIFVLYRSRWESIDYTHAYFILPVSLGIAWLKRAKIKEAASKGNISGLLFIAIGALLFILGWKNDYLSISTLSLIPMLYGIVIYLYGLKLAKVLSFPILYLLLIVPPPLGVLDSLTLPMRYWISILTEKILVLLQYPMTRDGLMLSIGGHDIYMGPACSGFRSLITMISLGLAYIYIIKGTKLQKIVLLSSIVPLALLGNLFRVISVCLVTFYLGDKAGHDYHDVSGFVIFIILVLGLVGIENLLLKIKASGSKPQAPSK